MEIDKDLTWKSHIEKVHCMGKLAVIRRAGSYLPCHIQKLLYQAFIPHLDYCSVVWNGCGQGLSDRVERIQSYALTMILRKPPLTSSKLLRQTLGWTTLRARRHHVRSIVAALTKHHVRSIVAALTKHLHTYALSSL